MKKAEPTKFHADVWPRFERPLVWLLELRRSALRKFHTGMTPKKAKAQPKTTGKTRCKTHESG
jgi:hypothetical protein